MAAHPKARVVPFSSVVGSNVTLHDPETGRVVGQLALLNIGGSTPEDWKQRSILIADDTAKRINGYDELVSLAREILSAHKEGNLPGPDGKWLMRAAKKALLSAGVTP